MRIKGESDGIIFDWSEDYHDDESTAQYIARKLEESGFTHIIVTENES